MQRFARRTGKSGFKSCVSLAAASLLSACATAPLEQAGSLRSYENLKPSDGVVTRSLLNLNKDDVLAAKTVKIIPTSFSAAAASVPFTATQRRLVTNAVDRSLCAGLSHRFEVVDSSQPADLTVQAVITHVTPTDKAAVGLSKGASIAKTIFLPGVPVPIPRVPVGLGSLSLEAEARNHSGDQKAAMVWGRGASALFGGSGRMSEEGDAYTLAAAFGEDFSKMLVTGSTPFGGSPTLPPAESLGPLFGGKHKYPACEAFGRFPGLAGVLGDQMALPPEWTDKGPVTP
nr:DUF3313 domain-containing protein [Pseudorhodoplanes sinuspersici]